MKKVLFVINALTCGGMEEVLLGILDSMDKEYKVDILTFYERDISQAYKFEEKGCRIYRVPRVTRGALKFTYKCRKLIKQNKYDYVQTMVDFNGIFVALASIGTGVKKVICQSHSNTWTRIHNHLFQKIIQRLFQILPCELLAVSNDSAERLFGNGNKKVHIAKNGIDTNKYGFDETIRKNKRKEMNCENKLVIGNVGRLAVQKNHKKQIEILEEIIKLDVNVEYWMIGDGECRSEVENMIKQRQLRKYVKMMSYRSDVNELLQAMDIFLLPSLFEGLPVSIIEAQCSGVLCVTSNMVPIESDITGNVIFLNLEDDSKVWAKKIMNSYKNFTRINQSNKIMSAGYDRNTSYKIYIDIMND